MNNNNFSIDYKYFLMRVFKKLFKIVFFISKKRDGYFKNNHKEPYSNE